MNTILGAPERRLSVEYKAKAGPLTLDFVDGVKSAISINRKRFPHIKLKAHMNANGQLNLATKLTRVL